MEILGGDMRDLLVVVTALLALSTAPASVADPMFTGLGFLPGQDRSTAVDVSANGAVIVGFSSTPDRAVMWTGTAIANLGAFDLPGTDYSWADGVSADGTMVVGSSTATEVYEHPFFWSAATGMQDLGTVPGGNTTVAQAISADGSVIVGYAYRSDGLPVPVRWANGVPSLLLDNHGNEFPAQAMDVSDAGTRIIGGIRDPMYVSDEAFLWEPTGMTALGFLPNTSSSTATAISRNGQVIVGWSGDEAFRWRNGVMEGLGTLPGFGGSYATAVSNDGTIVGTIYGTYPETHVFIWDEQHGMRLLENVLTELGVDSNGWTLDEVFGISADGLTIVGDGINPNGDTEAWLLVIPEPSTGLLLVLGLAGLAKTRKRQPGLVGL